MSHLLICPICYSTNVVMDSGGITGKYYCKDCGYIGMAIEMTEGEYKELMKSEKYSMGSHAEEKHHIHDKEEHR